MAKRKATKRLSATPAAGVCGVFHRPHSSKMAGVLASLTVLATAVVLSHYSRPGWSSQSSPATPPSASAVSLANLINSGDPVDVEFEMALSTLEAALGELHPTDLGWRQRRGSFFELLVHSPPERWSEEALLEHGSDVFDAPFIVERANGGVSGSGVVPKRMTSANMHAENLTVHPSYASSLAVNYGPPPLDSDGELNADLMPFSGCRASASCPFASLLRNRGCRTACPLGRGRTATCSFRRTAYGDPRCRG
jgi:hypothetical protein